MSRGEKNSNIDRVLELFAEKRLYIEFKPLIAFVIELILRTGATPADIVNIQVKDVNTSTNTLTLHPQKKKTLPSSTHKLSKQAISTFLELEKHKSLSSYSIRRLQQLLKEETSRVRSKFTTSRSLRKHYLSTIAHDSQRFNVATTQLTSVEARDTLDIRDQNILRKATYSPKNKALILTLLDTGIRISELLALEKKHIKKNQLVISEQISYNKQTRHIPLPRILKQEHKHKYLFSSKNKALTQRRFQQICHEVAEKLDIKILTPNIIRATAIANLSRILSQEELQKQTGLNTSTLYTHGFLATKTTRTQTTQDVLENSSLEFDENGEDDFMYHRSKLKKGGDTDE